METKKNKRKRLFVSMGILLSIIVIFPLISLFYLNKGLDYRKGQLSTLDELGAVESFSAKNQEGKSINATTGGNVYFISHSSLTCNEDRNQTVKEFVDKFINQDAFRHVIVSDGKDCEGWDTSYFADDEQSKSLKKQFKSLVTNSGLSSKTILVDRENQIRRVYDLTVKEEIESLITHTTTLLPPYKKRG